MSAHHIVASLVTITALSSYVNHKFIKLPTSIGLTLITLVFSLCLLFVTKLGFDVSHYLKQFLNGIEFNEAFLNGMLSFLLFAVSLHINVIELAKQKWVIFLLATVGVVVSTVVVGVATWCVTHSLGLEISWAYCMVFGALISPTDPIAVLGIMKKLKVPKSLEMKIAGESLFNDGMGIVLFLVLLGVATGQQNNLSSAQISLFFLQQGLGGIVFGAVLGYVASKLLKDVDNYEVAVLITLAVVTGGYAFAHSVLDVSGVIAMAVAGLIIGANCRKNNMSKETVKRLDGFWELIDDVLNAILFVLIGLEFIQLSFDWKVGIAAICSIVIVLFARWISVTIPIMWLTMFKRFKPGVIKILTWGGLRGGIAIALALSIPHSPERNFIVTITYAVVIFSILVQGLTIGPLIRRLVHSPKGN